MKKRSYMNRIKSVLLAVIMVITVALPVSAVDLGEDNEVTLNLTFNNKLSAEVSPTLVTAKNRASSNDDISFSFSRDTSGFSTAVLALTWEGDTHNVNMFGSTSEVVAGQHSGTVGAFWGEFYVDGSVIPVCLNITYNESGNIATISVGAASETSTPYFAVYGNFTDSLAAINQEYAETQSAAASMMETGADIATRNVNDNSIYYKDHEEIKVYNNTYTLGAIALYSANNNEQGEDTNVFGRLVANSENARSYLVNTQNVTSSLIYDIYPSRFDLTLASNNSSFGSSGVLRPGESETSISAPAMFYLGEVMGWYTVTIEYTMSSVAHDLTNLTSAGYKTVNWDIFKRNGFGNEVEGNVTDILSHTDGLWAFAEYSYQGYISPNGQVNVTMTASGNITYEYQYVTTSGMLPFNFVTSTKSATGITTVYAG